MKGIQGLGVAFALGLAGALLNFAYLNNKSRDVEKVYFLGIAADSAVGPGERINEDDLTAVGIPERWVGNLRDFAIEDQEIDRQAVIGTRAYRLLPGGSLLLRDDLKTPPPDLELADDERAWGIPVHVRCFPAHNNRPSRPTKPSRSARRVRPTSLVRSRCSRWATGSVRPR